MNLITGFLKAHFAGLGAAFVLLEADLSSSPGHDLGSLTGYQWLAVIAAGLGVGAVVAAVPNASVPALPAVAQDVVTVPDEVAV